MGGSVEEKGILKVTDVFTERMGPELRVFLGEGCLTV